MAALTTIYHYDNGDEFPVDWVITADAEQWQAGCTPWLEHAVTQGDNGSRISPSKGRFIQC